MAESLVPTRAPGVQVPPSPATPTHEPSTFSTAHCVWSHALHLFHNHDWQSSLRHFKSLLYHCPSINRYEKAAARLRYNIGILEAILGAYFRAGEEFKKCLDLDNSFALAWYALGLAHSELKDFRGALKAFEECFNSMKAEEVEYKISAREDSMTGLGDSWKLEKVSVDSNIRKAFEEKEWKAHRVRKPMGDKWALNGIPVGVIFEPSADTFKVKVNLNGPLLWENDGLNEYLMRYNLDAKESQSRTISTKRERASSVATVTQSRTVLMKLERRPSVATVTRSRTTSTKRERDSSRKLLPPLPSATPGAEPPLPAEQASAVRSQMIDKLDIARRRRMKNSPERATPSRIVPPKVGSQDVTPSRTATSAPSTSNPIENPQETIRGPRTDNPRIGRTSSVLPLGSPLTDSSSLFAQDTRLLPHELPHLPEVASRALARRCSNHDSIQCYDCNSFTCSSESLARQTHPETPTTATIDFTHEYHSYPNTRYTSESQTGLHITGLDGLGKRERGISSPRPNSSIYKSYSKREWATDDEISNELENDDDTEQETEDENQDYFEICLLPLTYQRPQYNNQDPSETLDETQNNRRISMFIDRRGDSQPASSVYSTQGERFSGFVNPPEAPRPASSVYSTQNQPRSMYSKTEPRPASSIYSTEPSIFANQTPDPRPPSSIYSNRNRSISMSGKADPRPASSTYSTDTSTSANQEAKPRPPSSIDSKRIRSVSMHGAVDPSLASSIYSTEISPSANQSPDPPAPSSIHANRNRSISMSGKTDPRPASSIYSTHPNRTSTSINSIEGPWSPSSLYSKLNRSVSIYSIPLCYRPASPVDSTDTVRAAADTVESPALDQACEAGSKEEVMLLPTVFEGFEVRRG